jgi:hypothetical protein
MGRCSCRTLRLPETEEIDSMPARCRATLLMLLATLAPQPALAAVLAGPIVNPATGHAYYLLAPATWQAAEAEAQSLGGHLVAILDAAENAWVSETFSALASGPFWIGLTDADQEGVWSWTSGRFFDYASWWTAGGQPDNAGGVEHYVEINNYLWNDNNATAVFRGIAEVVPPGPLRVRVDWSADVFGAHGPGTLSGSFGTFEPPDEGVPLPLPAGAALDCTASGFGGAFPNGSYPLALEFGGGLFLRFDSLDPLRATLVGDGSTEVPSRYSNGYPCGEGSCRVIYQRYTTGPFDLVSAGRLVGPLESYSEALNPVYTYTVIPETGAAGAWTALAAIAILARRRRA